MKYQKVIICGRRCTGKSTLLWELQKRLNWPIFSISMYLRDYIRQYNLSPKDVQDKRVEIGKDVDTRITNLINGPSNCLIEAKVYEHIRESLPATAKILLTASRQVCFERNAFREGIEVKAAEKRVIKKEIEWEAQMAEIFGFKDFYEPVYYDLMVDTSVMSREQVADAVENWLI